MTQKTQTWYFVAPPQCTVPVDPTCVSELLLFILQNPALVSCQASSSEAAWETFGPLEFRTVSIQVFSDSRTPKTLFGAPPVVGCALSKWRQSQQFCGPLVIWLESGMYRVQGQPSRTPSSLLIFPLQVGIVDRVDRVKV